MEATYRVAIVIPIYNVEQYLTACLDSVAKLIEFKTFQIILVNDGSTDRSLAIATVWAMNKDNVVLIDQKNQGLGAARNRGLKEVDAEFVTFLDSDDILTNYSIDALYRNAKHRGSEIAVGKLETFPVRQQFIYDANHVGAPLRANKLEDAPLLMHNPSSCNKIFSMDLVRREKLKFGVGVHFEDVYFTIPAMLAAKRLSIIPRVTYRYRKVNNGGSIMNSLFTRPKNYWDHLACNEFILKKSYGSATPARKKLLERFFFRSIEGFTLRAPEVFEGEELSTFFKRAKKLYDNFSPLVAADACRDIRHKLPLFAIMTGNFPLYEAGMSAVDKVKVAGKEVEFVLAKEFAQKTTAPFKRMLRENRFEAFLDGMQADYKAKTLNFAGRFRLPGIVFKADPNLEVTLRIGGRKFAMKTWVRLNNKSMNPTGWVDFEGSVPLSKAPIKSDFVWISLSTGERGSISRRCLYGRGFVRRFRNIRLKQRELRVVLEKQRVFVSVDAVGTLKARVEKLKRRIAEGKAGVLYPELRIWRRLGRFVAPKQGYWLFSERSNTARESSKDLFNHLVGQGYRNVRYVIEADSPERANLAKSKYVVTRNSLRHLVLSLNARLFIGTHDIYAYQMHSKLSDNKVLNHLLHEGRSKFVFLQHGVIYNDVSPALNYEVTGFEGFVTTAAEETEFVKRRFGLRDTVKRVGLARWAKPVPESTGKKFVLFAPTWRQYLGTPSYHNAATTKNSDAIEAFTHRFTEVFDHPELQSALKSKRAEMVFVGHYELEHLDIHKTFGKHKNVRIITSKDADLSELIRGCSMFVTDWSSTFFDAAYFGKPVVHYPFDQKEFRAGQYREGYFKFKRDGFGPVATTPDALAHEIAQVIKSGFERPELYTKRADKFFGGQVQLADSEQALLALSTS